MKIQTTIFLFLLSITSTAQLYGDVVYQLETQTPIVHQAVIPTDQINYTFIDKKGKEISYQKIYNEKGKLVSYHKIINSKKTPIATFEYNNNSPTIRIFKKEKLENTIYKTTTEKGKITENKLVNTKGKIIRRTNWEYNSDGCISNIIRYKKNDKKVNEWIFEYYDNCKKSKSTLYDGKGKISYTRVYDCNEEGENLDKIKNNVRVCKWEESTADYFIEIEESFGKKGKSRRIVKKYTLSDTLLIEKTRYNESDQLIKKTIFDPNIGKVLTTTGYKKGKAINTTTYKYNKGLVALHRFEHKGKTKIERKYIYTDSLLTKLLVYKKGKLDHTVLVNYEQL